MSDNVLMELSAEEVAAQAELEKGESTEPDDLPTEEVPATAPPEVEKQVEEPKPEEPVKMVPIHALHEARLEAKELRRQLGVVNELKTQITQMRTERQKTAEPAPPSKEEQPVDYVIHKVEQIDKQQQQQAQWFEQQQQQNQMQQMVSHVKGLEDTFRKTTPDYDAAFEYLSTARRMELEEFGVAEEIIDQELQKNAINTAIISIQNRKNPAQVIYNLAKARGYKGPAPAKPAAPVGPAKELLETVKKGQEKVTKPLGGADTERDADLNALLSAEGEDFDQLWQKTFGKSK